MKKLEEINENHLVICRKRRDELLKKRLRSIFAVVCLLKTIKEVLVVLVRDKRRSKLTEIQFQTRGDAVCIERIRGISSECGFARDKLICNSDVITLCARDTEDTFGVNGVSINPFKLLSPYPVKDGPVPE